ncbi:putative peptidoglycan binding domain-containing protein [Promicromonospora umidemergens]|uniref:Peptidoglycan binding-like domain-containing protein n=1 Tax=Promicromonospora umidemergens TaxID=629679 RepID=A0ABP8WDA3_9MICO|nr:putative peptidoglycan binding domain-containing protein [Promicromonospora umidemergens]
MLGAFFFAFAVVFGMVAVAVPTASAVAAPAAYEKCNAARVVYTSGVYYRMPARGTTTTCWLAYDRSYSNPAVNALQTHIKRCYIDTNRISWSGAFDVDGFFGNDTVSALKKVQAYEGLGQDGEYGPTARSAMHLRWSELSSGGGRGGCGDGGYFT